VTHVPGPSRNQATASGTTKPANSGIPSLERQTRSSIMSSTRVGSSASSNSHAWTPPRSSGSKTTSSNMYSRLPASSRQRRTTAGCSPLSDRAEAIR